MADPYAPPSTGTGRATGDLYAPPHTGPDQESELTGEERIILRQLYRRARDHADNEIGPKLEKAYRYLDGKVDAQPAFHVGKDEQGRPEFHGSRVVVRECRDKLRAIVPGAGAGVSVQRRDRGVHAEDQAG